MRKSLVSTLVQRIALLASVLIAWQLLASSPLFAGGTLPTVPVFVSAAVQVVPTAAYWAAIGNTMFSWLIGLAISAVIAVPIGLLIGSTAFLRRLTGPTVDFMRTIPSIILVPLAVLLYGSTNHMKVILIVFASIWPLLVQAMYGIRSVDTVARETYRAYSVRWIDRVRFLFLPSAGPYLATGLRLSAVSSLLVAIGVEIIASAPGIGYQIGVKQANALAGESFVFLITSAVIGLLITLVFTVIERWVMYWHPSVRGAAA